MHKHTNPSCKAQCARCGKVRQIDEMRYTVHVAQDLIGLVGTWECAQCPTKQVRNSKAVKTTPAVAHKQESSVKQVQVQIEW